MAPKIVTIGLKIVELGLLVAATGLITNFVNEFHKDKTDSTDKIDQLDRGKFGRHEFFLYTTAVGVIIALVFIVNLINGSGDKENGAFAMFAVHLLWAVQLLASAGMLYKVLRTYEKKVAGRSECSFWKEQDKDYQCNHVIGGVACGFFASVLFLVDTIIYYKQS